MRAQGNAARGPLVSDGAAVGWPAVSSAVALLTALREDEPVAPAEFTSGHAPGEVTAALAIIATALLNVAAPGETGDLALRNIGLVAATQGLPGGDL